MSIDTQSTIETATDEAIDSGGEQLAESTLVDEELLVEEVSIDGMCGVY